MAFAGLWEHWEDQEGKESIESCTILTTEAGDPVAILHDRMPVILEQDNFHLWLDPQEKRVEKLHGLMGSTAVGILAMYPVSKCVNKAGNEGEGCIEPVR